MTTLGIELHNRLLSEAHDSSGPNLLPLSCSGTPVAADDWQCAFQILSNMEELQVQTEAGLAG